MPLWKSAVIAGVAGLALTGAASAADLISYGTSASGASEIPVAPASAPVNWNGFYAGIYGVDQNGQTSGNRLGVGAVAGANLAFDYVLVGGEVSIHGLDAPGPLSGYGQALGRVGVLATDNALIYASVGAGLDLGLPDEKDILVGGGLEYAVTDNVSLRAQYLHGFPVSGGSDAKDQFTLGANYHF